MTNAATAGSLGVLSRFIRRNRPAERCDLCGSALAESHPHLVDPAARKLMCACRDCTILLAGRYRLVPERVRYLQDFRMTDAQWEQLSIPINVAFFLQSSAVGRTVALYPSPAGAPESLLPLDTWNEIAQANPVLAEIQPDVEALLVNRLAAPEYYIAPIDECYRLVGLIRMKWRGLSGGEEVWAEIARFFADLQGKAHA